MMHQQGQRPFPEESLVPNVAGDHRDGDRMAIAWCSVRKATRD